MSEDKDHRHHRHHHGEEKSEDREKRKHDRHEKSSSHGSRTHSRSRSPDRKKRHREEPKVAAVAPPPVLPPAPEKAVETEKTLPKEITDTDLLAKFGLPVGFSSTKGTKVAGNEAGAVSIRTAREYRQYMNRRGGFNRPLDPEPGFKHRK